MMKLNSTTLIFTSRFQMLDFDCRNCLTISIFVVDDVVCPRRPSVIPLRLLPGPVSGNGASSS